MTIIALCIQPLPYILCFAIVLIRAFVIIILNFYPFREAPVFEDSTCYYLCCYAITVTFILWT